MKILPKLKTTHFLAILCSRVVFSFVMFMFWKVNKTILEGISQQTDKNNNISE